MGTRAGRRNHVLQMRVQIPMGRGNFEGEGRSIVKYGHCMITYAKTAVPIEMPFELWVGMGPRNRVLDAGLDSSYEEAVIKEKDVPVHARDTLP